MRMLQVQFLSVAFLCLFKNGAKMKYLSIVSSFVWAHSKSFLHFISNEDKFVYRFWFYMLALAISTYWGIRIEFVQSKIAYDAGDPSAYAWTYFLPFLIPLFIFYALMKVVPPIVIAEAAFWVYNKFFRGEE